MAGRRRIKPRKCRRRGEKRGQSDWKVTVRRQRLEEEKVKEEVEDLWR